MATFTGDDNANTVAGTNFDDQMFMLGGDDFVLGYFGDDLIRLDDGDDVGDGKAGNDIVFGGNGNDKLYGDYGDDVLRGGADNDMAYGGYGDDVMSGDAGDDLLFGSGGNDMLTGGVGDDRIDGGYGNDIIDGGDGIDTASYVDSPAGVVVNLTTGRASGGHDNDILASIERIVGSSFADTLTGSALGDELEGGSGGDRLDGRAGADMVKGGSGNDTYYVDDAGDKVIEAVGEGTDKVYAGVSYALAAGQEVEWLRANAGATGLTLKGNELRNTLQGNAGDDRLYGGSGADKLYGYGGNDRLDGGRWADVMAGGVGNDVYYVDNAGDQVIEVVGEGSDKVYAKVDYTLGAGQVIEWLRANAGNTGLTLTGNERRNTLQGGAGNDTLDGGSGGDRLYGGDGADVFVFDTPFIGVPNVDTIADFEIAQDAIRLDHNWFAGLALGQLAAAAFAIDNPTGTGPQIVYNSTTGTLSYDGNGADPGGASSFAKVTGIPVLTADRFGVV